MPITYLSYSSACTLQACEAKYVYRKVENLPVDSDAVTDKESFRFGKGFHKIQEDTMHKRLKPSALEKKLEEIIPMFNLTFAEHGYGLFACCEAYYDLHEKSEMEVIAVETPVKTETFEGIVDATLLDKSGYWWICDLKTSAYADVAMFKRLAFDPQLNLYAHHAYLLAEALKLDMNKFAGVRYRSVQKPRYAPFAKETYSAYSQRIMAKCFDVGVLKADLHTEEIFKQHVNLLVKALKFDRSEATPMRNRGACYQFNTPCEYWSRCHGGREFSQEGVVQINDRVSMTKVTYNIPIEDIL